MKQVNHPDHQGNNLVEPSEVNRKFRVPGCQFEVSSREIIPDIEIMDYLKIYYMYLQMDQIGSVFGNALYPSRLYGGRPFRLKHCLTDRHIETLNAHGIGVTLTMTNHYFDEATFRANHHFFKRHHRKGNAIVCTNDTLARRIKEAFPDYTLKASLIKNLDRLEKVEHALTLYDKAVIPMNKNDDDAFLHALPEKERIVIFATSNCAYNCAARTCYVSMSQFQWGKGTEFRCSKSWLPRPNLGFNFFNIEKLVDMGFSQFKVVPNKTKEASAFMQLKAQQFRKQHYTGAAPIAKQAIELHSFPKCGRTWLRFLLANYFNLAFKLHISINLQSLFTLLPNDGYGLKGVEQFQFSHVRGLPLIISSHSKSRAMSASGILMLRSIPDVVVSDYFQQQKLGFFKGSLSEFMRDEKGSLHRYCAYLNSCTGGDASPAQHIITYEQLHRDTAGELRRLLQILKLKPDEPMIAEAVTASSFERMKEIEIALGHAGMPSVRKNPEMRKVRKGKVGGYVDYFSAEDINQLHALTEELLTPAAKHLLAEFDLLPAKEAP